TARRRRGEGRREGAAMKDLCNDCGVDTDPFPPRRGAAEQYIVNDDVWSAARMAPGRLREDFSLRGGGFLCVGCIEKRLGRLLTREDFKPATIQLYAAAQSTPRLLSRFGLDPMAFIGQPLPPSAVRSWAAGILKACLKDTELGDGLLKVEIDGDDVFLEYKDEVIHYRAEPGLKDFVIFLRRNPDHDLVLAHVAAG